MTRAKKSHLDPAIHRVRLDRLTIFEITESELEALERGSPESPYLNMGIAVLSVAVSFYISLATATIDSIKTYCLFVIVTVVGYLAAVTFGLLWWQSRRSLKKVAQEIRSRIAPEGIQEGPEGGEAVSSQEGDVDS
jgi:hypothetical protein